MSKEEWFGLKKGQRRFITQLVEYMETEDIFSKKDSFDILSMENIPGAEHHSSKMAARYTLKPEWFINKLKQILKRGYYTESEKDGLGIVREYCRQKNYPFQDFVFDPKKETD